MKQITDHIYQLDLGIVNAFVIEDNGLTLIDSGPKNSADKIFAAIKKAGKNPANLKQLILTHLHSDHTGSAAEIKRRLGIPVLAHPADAPLIAQGAAARGDMELSPGILNWVIYNAFIRRATRTVEPVAIDTLLNDGDTLPLAGGVQVIHTPGHSAGHIALLVKNEGLLIAADICGNIPSLGLSIVYEDIDLGIQSILKAASFSFDKAIFGHGKPLMKNADKIMRETFMAIAAKSKG